MNGTDVAVKIQHPELDALAPIDIRVCSSIVHTVKKILPQFEFEWLADELQSSLPEELDFVREANNGEATRELFKGNPNFHIPRVYFSSRRVLIMEYIEGGKVNDLAYLEKHNIDKYEVSRSLSNMYAQMIFTLGWVHCDPVRKCLLTNSILETCLCVQ
jgi:aarF domain-containing kinase